LHCGIENVEELRAMVLKEEVLKLEVQHFLTLPDDENPNKKPLP
jgi:methyl coenzyme M reductase subunit C-like uncharacterized protein (methanogenesis marker protein 7)